LKQAEFGRQRRYTPESERKTLILVNFFIVLSKKTYTDDPPFDNRGAGWTSDTRSKGEVERASLIKEGPRLFPFATHISRNLNVRYRPQHSSRNLISKPWAADICPNLRCHNKKGGGNNTRHSRKGKRVR
jgi:hypothetical protein